MHTSAYNNINCNTTSTCIIPTWGALGCALSHINCLKWISYNYNENEYYLIVEDDINIINLNLFKLKLMQAISIYDKNKFNGELPNNNKLHNMENNYKKHALMVFLGLNNSINISKKYEYDLYGINKKFIGTHCYFVNKKACDIILNKIFPIKYQIDIQYSYLNYKYNNSMNKYYLNMYNLINNGVEQVRHYESDVQYKILTLNQVKYIFKILPVEICNKIFNYVSDLENIRNKNYNYCKNSSSEMYFDDYMLYNYYNYYSYMSTPTPTPMPTPTPTTTPAPMSYSYNNNTTPTTYTYS